MALSPDEIVFLVFLISVVILAVAVLVLEIKIRRLLKGKNAKTIDETLVSIDRDCKQLEKFQKDVEKYLLTVENRLKMSIRGVGTVRFNAFEGTATGGNQSFASALLNEKGDGVVISSLYSRGFVGVYAKPISAGASKYELSEEEKTAIKQAIEAVKKA